MTITELMLQSLNHFDFLYLLGGCIIISKPGKKKLSKDIYEECFRSNSHGAGFAYIIDHNIVVEKGFFGFDAFYKAVKEVEEMPLLLHFRVASHGPQNHDNCHPFVYQPKDSRYQFVMAHNGILDWRSTTKKSDTSCFSEDFLFPMLERHPNLLDTAAGILLFERFINHKNKMVIVRYDVQENKYSTYIINKSAGNEHNGCWFSNWSWKPCRGMAGYYGGMGGMGYALGAGSTQFTGSNHYRGGGDDGFGYNQGSPCGHAGSKQKPLGIRNPCERGDDGLYGWTKNKHGLWVNRMSGEACIGKNGAPLSVGMDIDLDKIKETDTLEDVKKLAAEAEAVGEDAGPSDDGDKPSTTMPHLTKSERKAYHRLATDYIKARKTKQILQGMERIEYLRDAMRKKFPAWAQLTNEALDKNIVNEEEDVIISVAEAEANDDAQAEIELRRAEGVAKN